MSTTYQKVKEIFGKIKFLKHKTNSDLATINTHQLEKDELKQLDKTLPSKHKTIRRRLTIKKPKTSKSFRKWLLNNLEK